MAPEDQKNPAGDAGEPIETAPAVEPKTSQADWVEINARWKRQREEVRARRKAERSELLEALRGMGVEEIEAC